MTNKKKGKGKRVQEISLRNIQERREEITPIIAKLSEFQLSSQYEPVLKLMQIFQTFIKEGGVHEISIPFPEIKKKIKGFLTDNKKNEIWVKLESSN